jgi:hypothetical protein
MNTREGGLRPIEGNKGAERHSAGEQIRNDHEAGSDARNRALILREIAEVTKS